MQELSKFEDKLMIQPDHNVGNYQYEFSEWLINARKSLQFLLLHVMIYQIPLCLGDCALAMGDYEEAFISMQTSHCSVWGTLSQKTLWAMTGGVPAHTFLMACIERGKKVPSPFYIRWAGIYSITRHAKSAQRQAMCTHRQM